MRTTERRSTAGSTGTTRRRIGATAVTAGAALLLAGCGGGSYDDSRDLYEELRVNFNCDTVDSDDFNSFMEGELTDGFPAFDVVDGDCQLEDDDSVTVSTVVPHDVKGKDFMEAFAEENDEEGYGLLAKNWVILVDEDDPAVQEWLETVKDELGGELITLSGQGGSDY
ncbi:MAG: hypothetical protein ACTIA5_03245 [Brachybacterium tyrofermentans]|uniref:Uncharacterized protein n=1 Tax=Brachybacterium tyrofermentans TaxID=47848 RepID=A0ABW0FHT1_9MICO